MNRIHKIVWNAASGNWVVTSEIARSNKRKSQTIRRALNLLAFLSGGLFLAQVSHAGSCNVSTTGEFSSALNNTSCDKIVLQNDITLSSRVAATFNGRQSIVVDGNGYQLLRTGTSGIVFSDAEVSSTGENLQFVIQNFDTITASGNTSNPIVWVRNSSSTVDVVFDGIYNMPGNMYSVLGYNINSDVNTQVPNSYLVIGDIFNGATMQLNSFKQVAEAAKIRLTGKWSLQTTGGGNHARVFWSNSDLNKNEVHFTSSARVSVKLASGDNFTSGGGGLYDRGSGNGFRYIFEDGAEFQLWGQQNVFGSPLPANGNGINIGIRLGTYDKITQTWGEGVRLQVAGVNGTQLSGNGLANLSGHASGIDNGPGGTEDVIFNLKEGSTLNVGDVGIYTRKDAGNSSGIYLRSATDIFADIGIKVEHNGDGEVIVANSGTISGTQAGVLLLSTSNNTMLLDNSGGVFNMDSGAGIKVGTSTTDGNVNVHLIGGTINLSGDANGLDFSHSLTSNSHTITDTVINLAQGATGEAFVSSEHNSQFTVKNITVNLYDSIGFTDINNVTFALGDNGERNQIFVKGAGIGVQVDKDLSQFANAHLDINVTDASGVIGSTGTGTGVQITGGTFADTILVSEGLSINAKGATAIEVTSTDGRQLTNEGNVLGDILFSNSTGGNVIINAGTINGRLISNSGDDHLTLLSGSVSEGEINLGDGNNTVVVNNGASFARIVTGDDNDTFIFNNLTQSSGTQLGLIAAGGGSNTLTVNDSQHTLNTATQLQDFATVNLNNTSLGLVNVSNIASGDVVIANDSTLAFEGQYSGAFSAVLKGAGTTEIKDGAHVQLQHGNTGFSGVFAVQEGGTLTVNNANQLGSASVALDGTLDIRGLNSFNHQLTGASTGVMIVDSNAASFNFGTSVGNQYQGNVNLTNSLFTLAGNNTTVLTNATLTAASGSVVTVGSGQQSIGGLSFSGGTVTFGNISENMGQLTADNTVNARTIDASQSGTVKVNLPAGLTPHTSGNTLLEMDEGTLLVTLATGSATGSAGNLSLQDMGGSAISNAQQHAIYNHGSSTVSAQGTFDYRLTTGAGSDGLYLSYGLTELDLLGQGNDALKLEATAAGNGSNDNDLSAKVTGNGDLRIDTAAGSMISLSNTNNDYTGRTIVASGMLQLNANSALGNTSALEIQSAGLVDLNGKSQTVGGLFSVSGSELSLNQGTLRVLNGGAVDGNLTGSGRLEAASGQLSITGDNASLAAQVQIDSAASVVLNHISGLGQSRVNIEGALALDNVQGGLNNQLTGDGQLVLNNLSHVELLQNSNTFEGQVLIHAGSSLKASSVAQLGQASIQDDGMLTLAINTQDEVLNSVVSGSGVIIKEGLHTLSIGQSLNQHTGNVEVRQGELFIGSGIELGQQAPGKTVHISSGAMLSGAGSVHGDVTNNGMIVVAQSPAAAMIAARGPALSSATLTLNNHFQNHGQVYLSPSAAVGSRLIVAGDYQGHAGAGIHMNTILEDDGSATDQLIIQGHAGGNTALYVSNVGGAGAQTVEGIKIIDTGTSDAQAFSLANTLVAGAYEYQLYQNPANQNWYLTSYLSTAPVRPIRPDAGVDTALQTNAVDTLIPGLSSAKGDNQLFGRHIGKSNSLWAFSTGSKSQGRLAGHVTYDASQYTLNVGGDTDVQVGDEYFIVGVSAHYSHGSANAHNRYTDSRASGSNDGYGIGVYGTWFTDPDKTYSPFVDVMLRYGYYKNSTQIAQSAIKSGYSANAWSFSVQGGYPMQVTENIMFEPQAQLTYVSYNANDYHDTEGNHVSQSMKGHVAGRIGAYVYSVDQDIQPYMGVNVWYDTTRNSETYNYNQNVRSQRRGIIYDFRVGVRSQVAEQWNVWGELGARQGRNHYQDWGGAIGIRYEW